MQYILISGVGFCVGILSGLFGIGGGVILVPALVFLLNYSQIQAQGLSLAVLTLPLLGAAAFTYSKKTTIDFRVVIVIALTMLVGSWIASSYACKLPEGLLRKVFSVFLVLIALKMFLDK